MMSHSLHRLTVHNSGSCQFDGIIAVGATGGARTSGLQRCRSTGVPDSTEKHPDRELKPALVGLLALAGRLWSHEVLEQVFMRHVRHQPCRVLSVAYPNLAPGNGPVEFLPNHVVKRVRPFLQEFPRQNRAAGPPRR